ncbi:MAG: GNAT family N-acetyltransferase [Alphaproteobacteria bacterium]|nr:GNAT family N-acetyltransferase [Alphaproteobacteria bacterium]
MILRPARRSDVAAISALLTAAFADRPGALRYEPTVVGFFLAELAGAMAVVAEHEGAVIGAALAGARQARLHDAALAAVHVGPVAVARAARRRGVARAMLAEVEARARAAGAALLTLTTQEADDARHLYAAQGYATLERIHPRVCPVPPVGPAPRRRAGPWRAEGFALDGRPHAVVEWGPLPRRIPATLAPRAVLEGPASALTLRWPVVGARSAHAVQVLAVDVPDGRWAGLADAVRAQARADGALAVWVMPGVADPLPGFSAEGVPASLRMVKPLDHLGRWAADRARAWDAWGPAP